MSNDLLYGAMFAVVYRTADYVACEAVCEFLAWGNGIEPVRYASGVSRSNALIKLLRQRQRRARLAPKEG